MAARVVLSFDDAIVQEVSLDKPVTVVGRHPTCDIVIDHPAVSGRHMLFRQVNRTVYVEDLASTNGTRVNGIATSHQVVHHLDLIELGKHRLHFFDEELLAGRVGSLESTVQTDYERTLLAAHAAAQKTATAAATSAAVRDDVDLTSTMAIPRDPSLRLGPAQESVRTDDAPAAALALKVLAGGKPGEVLSLNRPNTMIGVAGSDTALVIKRGKSFFLARLSGRNPPRLNRKELGPGTHPIAPQDVIDVGGWSFEVIQSGG
jgi:FHA domain-containing protein